MSALNEHIKKLNEKFVVCKVVVGKEVLGVTPHQMNIPESKKFKEAKFARDVNNFLWKMEQYFRAVNINDDVVKVNITS